MAATLHNLVFDDGLDQGLQNIAVAGDIDCHLCSAVPTTYTEATVTYTLGAAAAVSITGPFDGDTSGRKITVAAVVTESVSADGTATHLALVDTNNSTLLVTVSLASSVAVLNGETWSANAWDIEFADPS